MIITRPESGYTMVARHPVVPRLELSPETVVLVPGTSSEVVVEDALVEEQTDATIATNYRIRPDGFYDGLHYRSQTPDTALTRGDLAEYVSTGEAVIEAITGPNHQIFKRFMQEESSGSPKRLLSWIDGTLAKHASEAIDDLLDGLTASSATMDLFTTANHAAPNYIRNPNVWCASLGIALTGLSVWNSRTGQQFGWTLITPQQVTTCHHGNPFQVGDTGRWIALDGEVHSRYIIAVYQIPGTDVRVGVLNSSLPSAIRPVRLPPPDIKNYLRQTQYRVPALVRNQQGQATVTDLQYLMTGGRTTFLRPVEAQRLSFYRDLQFGDSGGGVFLIVAGELVYLGPSRTPFETAGVWHLDWVVAIAAADALGGVATGYLPERADMTFFTDFSDPLIGIAGLDVWRRSKRLYQHEGYAITNDGDPVGVWASNRGSEFRMIEDWAKRPHLLGGWVALDNGDDFLRRNQTRAAQWTMIARMKFTFIEGGWRMLYVNYQGFGVNDGPGPGEWLRLVNEGVAWSGNVTTIGLNDVHTVRLVRVSNTEINMYLDGMLIATNTSAAAADPHGYFALQYGSYAGIAYADRIVTSDEIEAIELDLEGLDP